jgi:hypothetical protein
MRRTLLLPTLAAAGLAALAAPGAALATNECDGLDVCISVPGPWVAVSGSPGGRLRTVEYQLACPRGSIAGGLDAVIQDPALGVRFLGSLGSPVNPGITTGRAVVFTAWWARRAPTAYRPILGCIPTSGGGGRGTTAVGPVKGKPPVRLVRTVRVRPGAVAGLTVRCRSGERLVGSSHAVAFRGRRAPGAGALAGVVVTRVERAGRVVVRARRGAAVPAAARVEVQVHAICAKGGA